MIRPSRNFIVHNWPLKLLAFFVALIIWLIFVPETKVNAEKTLAVRLEVRNVPREMELVEKPTETVDITVRAPKLILNEITPSNVFARLDLEGATIYQQDFPLSPGMVIVPPGAEVVAITPNQVSLRLEPAREVQLGVFPIIVGDPAAGFRVGRVEVSPPQVLVRGPESKVRSRDRVTTTPVDVTGLSQSAVFEREIIMPKPELRAVSPFGQVKVSVQIERIEGDVKAKPDRKPR
ncbi:MAG: CdaR family protein [Candidatus Aminicenantes bacterium]|nr:CdaR family protein [Candidatus Aminicenantes bacterium]